MASSIAGSLSCVSGVVPLRQEAAGPYSHGVKAFFSKRLPWPASSNALARLRAELTASGRAILDLSESNPTRVDLDPPSPDRLWPLGFFLDEANLQYQPDPRGLRRAREALAEEYAARHSHGPQTALRPDDFFLCASTSEAYGWLFKLLCDPGDAVLVPKPGYPLFDYLGGLESVELRPYRLEYTHPSGWSIDMESVQEALKRGRAKALILINPNNPTGSYIRAEERTELVSLCASSGCAIIADEVFYTFPVEDGTRSSFAGEEGVLTFVLDGLSKSLGLPQMKLGWIAISGPQDLRAEAEARLEIIADSYLSAGTPIMNALPRLLGYAQEFADKLRRRLALNLHSLRSLMEGPDSPHRVLRCGGGWTAIIESPRLASEEELALGLLEKEGLWLQPGFFFDMERELFFTMSLILKPESLAEGARAYLRFFSEQMR